MADNLVVLLGPPGAGKSVQARSLASRLGWERIASGDVLRASQDATIQAALQAGELPPSEQVEQVLIDHLKRVAPQQGIVLDGFPRTLDEATWLERVGPELGRQVRRVLHLDLDKERSVARLLQRNRSDDTAEAIAMRWQEYETHIRPVLEYYRPRGIVRQIDASKSVAEIAKLIEAALED